MEVAARKLVREAMRAAEKLTQREWSLLAVGAAMLGHANNISYTHRLPLILAMKSAILFE